MGKYLIEYSSGDTAEYSFTYKDDKASMFFTGQDWSIGTEDTLVATLKDTENGINIRFEGLKPIKLDYCQAEELYVLLTYYMKEMQDIKPIIYRVEKELV